MDDQKTKCLMCRREHHEGEMMRVPTVFRPAAHFVFSCKRYANAGMYLPTLKVFIGPILAGLEVKGSMPVCRVCRRETILWSVMLYVLIAGTVLMLITMR
jgi:hypothetical protein